jgi:hypothetical protein
MTKDVEKIAKRIYYANWKEHSPVWENTSENVRNFVRRQARAVLDEQPGSINPPVRLGQQEIADDPGN